LAIKNAKFQLNLPKHTVVTAASMRTPPNTSVSGLCDLAKAAVNIVYFGRFK